MLTVVMLVTLTVDGAAAADWTLAEPGDQVALVEQRPDAHKYVVVKQKSPPGDFLIATRTSVARVYEIFIAGQRQLLLAELGSRVALFDGAGRPLHQASFDTRDLEPQLRSQMRGARRQPANAPAARAAGVPIVGALIGIKKGLDACRKLERTFVLRPVARACKDYLERKIFRFMAKIVGFKTATSLLTCSQTMPRTTPWLARTIAKMVCG